MSFFSCSTVSPMLLSHFLTLAHPHPVMVITAASHPPPVLTVSSSYVKLSYCFCFIMSFFSCSTVSPMLLSHFLTLAHQHPVMVITAASHPPPVLTVSSSYVKLSYCFCFIMSFFSCSTVSPMLLSHFLTLAHPHPVMVITQPHTLHLY